MVCIFIMNYYKLFLIMKHLWYFSLIFLLYIAAIELEQFV